MAIALFYVIAVIIRALALKYQDLNARTFVVWLWNWARGIGPCLGAIVAVLVFKRDFYCTITGTSFWKSAISVLLPFAICFFLNRSLSFTLLGFIFSNQGGVSFTPTVIALYVVVIAGWFLIWYVPWGKLLSRKR